VPSPFTTNNPSIGLAATFLINQYTVRLGSVQPLQYIYCPSAQLSIKKLPFGKTTLSVCTTINQYCRLYIWTPSYQQTLCVCKPKNQKTFRPIDRAIKLSICTIINERTVCPTNTCYPSTNRLYLRTKLLTVC
jgi:hypothetical protein